RCNSVKGTRRLPIELERDLLAEAHIRIDDVKRLAAVIQSQRDMARLRRKNLGSAGAVALPS
ncbi:hypothetical protein, partial [Roseomonas haemaphysalidis]